MADARISQLLPMIKCSDCGEDVEFRKLGDHICSKAPPMPELPASLRKPSARGQPPPPVSTDSLYENSHSFNQGSTRSPVDRISPRYRESNDEYSRSTMESHREQKPSLPFLEKYTKQRSPTSTTSSTDSDFFIGNGKRSPAGGRAPPSGARDFDDDDDEGYGYSKSSAPKGYRRNDFDYGGGGRTRENSIRDMSEPFRNNSYDNHSFLSKPGLEYESIQRSRSQDDYYPPRGESRGPRDTNTSAGGGAFDALMQDLMREMGDTSLDGAGGGGGRGRGPAGIKGGKCARCGNGIEREEGFREALGKMFHTRCFHCSVCRKPLAKDYFELGGDLFCGRDYPGKNGAKAREMCAECHSPILSDAVFSNGKPYHREHVRCYHCRLPIERAAGGPVEHRGKIYCREDFADLFLPKCRACGLPVEGQAVCASKLEGKWHTHCFGCRTCRKPFPDGSFYVWENAPYCKRHYHKLNNSLCKKCDDAIEGPCAQTIEGWRFHPPCFTCVVCRAPITDVYYMVDKRFYCEAHVERQRRAEKRRTMFKQI
ncbi:uncharacterized protein VTP21DRAFT_9189 [Calcarisporiella thermophila]|uniref:uncharacterized protein n=1 Tax=Calcarisporiella thermophila TaxID=911321 RepID=UPI003741F109